MPPEIRYCATSDGVDIAYYVMGEGEPILLASAILFSNLQDDLRHAPEYARVGHGIGRGMRVVRYDPRGTGLSGRSFDYSMRARLTDLGAVVSAAGLQSFTLFGPLHGAATAIEYAAQHPERVTRLILYMPYARGEELRGSLSRYESFREAAYEDLDEWREYTYAVAASNFGYSNPDVIEEAARRFQKAMTPQSLRAYHESLREIDVRSSLSEVRAPTIVMYRAGAFSSGLTFEMARNVAAGIRGSTLVQTSGERGSLWSDEETRAVEQFLDIPPSDDAPTSPLRTPSEGAGTAIILFADIVDSTALTERMGDTAFRERARALDALLRAIISDAGGTAIDGKLVGDGVLATFPAASQAIDAGLRCGVTGEEAGLSLHLGIHAGDVIREQNNVFGGAVNIASRISALSGPGEVLVSDIVRGLARTSSSVTFEDRGEHVLKGVGEPQRVFGVRQKK